MPVRPPEVASANQTQLTPPPVAAFPLPPGLTIDVEGDFYALPGRLQTDAPIALRVESFGVAAFDRLVSRLLPEGEIEDLAAPFPASDPIGVCWTGADGPPAGEREQERRFLSRPPPALAGLPGQLEVQGEVVCLKGKGRRSRPLPFVSPFPLPACRWRGRQNHRGTLVG